MQGTLTPREEREGVGALALHIWGGGARPRCRYCPHLAAGMWSADTGTTSRQWPASLSSTSRSARRLRLSAAGRQTSTPSAFAATANLSPVCFWQTRCGQHPSFATFFPTLAYRLCHFVAVADPPVATTAHFPDTADTAAASFYRRPTILIDVRFMCDDRILPGLHHRRVGLRPRRLPQCDLPARPVSREEIQDLCQEMGGHHLI